MFLSKNKCFLIEIHKSVDLDFGEKSGVKRRSFLPKKGKKRFCKVVTLQNLVLVKYEEFRVFPLPLPEKIEDTEKRHRWTIGLSSSNDKKEREKQAKGDSTSLHIHSMCKEDKAWWVKGNVKSTFRKVKNVLFSYHYK